MSSKGGLMYHTTPAASMLQLLKFGTLSLQLALPTCTIPDTFRPHVKTHYFLQAFQSA